VTSPKTEPSTQDILDDSDIVHFVCNCDEDTALCGIDVSEADETDSLEDTCVVCVDLNEFPCPRCGYLPPCDDDFIIDEPFNGGWFS
jgi:hypothetical protein